MPLRGLIYLARLYDGYVETKNINLYSSTLKKLPIPQYFVFYNGTKEQPDETILQLTDAFESVSDNRQPCLQMCIRDRDWMIISHRRLLAPIIFVGLTALSVLIRTNLWQPFIIAA